MPTSKLVPIGYRVLIEVKEVEEKTAGGLVLPDQYREKQEFAEARGILRDMGNHAFDEISDPPVEGDMVIFPRYEGTEIREGGKLYRLIEDKYIICRVDVDPWAEDNA